MKKFSIDEKMKKFSIIFAKCGKFGFYNIFMPILVGSLWWAFLATQLNYSVHQLPFCIIGAFIGWNISKIIKRK